MSAGIENELVIAPTMKIGVQQLGRLKYRSEILGESEILGGVATLFEDNDQPGIVLTQGGALVDDVFEVSKARAVIRDNQETLGLEPLDIVLDSAAKEIHWTDGSRQMILATADQVSVLDATTETTVPYGDSPVPWLDISQAGTLVEQEEFAALPMSEASDRELRLARQDLNGSVLLYERHQILDIEGTGNDLLKVGELSAVIEPTSLQVSTEVGTVLNDTCGARLVGDRYGIPLPRTSYFQEGRTRKSSQKGYILGKWKPGVTKSVDVNSHERRLVHLTYQQREERYSPTGWYAVEGTYVGIDAPAMYGWSDGDAGEFLLGTAAEVLGGERVRRPGDLEFISISADRWVRETLNVAVSRHIWGGFDLALKPEELARFSEEELLAMRTKAEIWHRSTSGALQVGKETSLFTGKVRVHPEHIDDKSPVYTWEESWPVEPGTVTHENWRKEDFEMSLAADGSVGINFGEPLPSDIETRRIITLNYGDSGLAVEDQRIGDVTLLGMGNLEERVTQLSPEVAVWKVMNAVAEVVQEVRVEPGEMMAR